MAGCSGHDATSAWLDLDRNRVYDAGGEPGGSWGVGVAGSLGKGRFVVFGDDAIFQNRFLEGGNEHLGRNLARWLGGWL